MDNSTGSAGYLLAGSLISGDVVSVLSGGNGTLVFNPNVGVIATLIGALAVLMEVSSKLSMAGATLVSQALLQAWTIGSVIMLFGGLLGLLMGMVVFAIAVFAMWKLIGQPYCSSMSRKRKQFICQPSTAVV